MKKHIRKFKATWERIDMKPKDGQHTCKGDCTTRAMAYCLYDSLTYREIEREQYRLADEENHARGLCWGDGHSKVHRNTTGIWDKVMLNRGYVWVHFKRSIRRDVLAEILHDFAYPVITRSSGHVAVVFRGSVMDTWDSRGGRCKMVLVKAKDKSLIYSKIQCKVA